MSKDDAHVYTVDGGQLEIDTERLKVQDANGAAAEFPADAVLELKDAVDLAVSDFSGSQWFRADEVPKKDERG